ncbi:MAG: hypothetical protein N3E41_08950, partial [Thermofilaceae archaeon]|nr:hypothetical protein [Thermofilaceae archaeon]
MRAQRLAFNSFPVAVRTMFLGRKQGARVLSFNSFPVAVLVEAAIWWYPYITFNSFPVAVPCAWKLGT